MPTETIMPSITRYPGFFLLALCSPYALADQAEHEYRTVLTPTMAAFYVIDSEGRSVLDTPVVAVISSPNASPSRTVVTGRPSLKRKTWRKRGLSSVKSLRLKKKKHSAHRANRCERHGFYYTNNGRCIQPNLRGKKSR